MIFIAAALYCSWPLGFWLNPAASRTGLASELGAHGQPYSWFFIWADIASGLLVVVASLLLAQLHRVKGWRLTCLIMLAIYGVCGALDAGLPLHCVPSLQVCGPIFHDPELILHGVIDYIGSVTLLGTLIAAWIIARRQHRHWLPWIYGVGIAGIVFALLSLLFMIIGGPGYWAQRYYITIGCIWVASIPFVLRGKRLYAKST